MRWRREAALYALVLACFFLAQGFRVDSLPFPPRAAYSDSAISRLPDTLHFQRSWREYGVFPFWNPHLMGGQPFAANPGTKVWYPLTWLALLWPASLHITLMTAFHLMWGALGLRFWAQRTGMGAWGAFAAGLAFLLSPKLLAHAGAGHTDLLMALAWTPWALAGLEALVIRPSPAWGGVLLGLSLGMMAVGALQLLPYLYGLVLFRGGWLIWEKRAPLPWGVLMLALFLALGLTGGLWLSLWELRGTLSRTELSVEDASLYAFEPVALLGLVLANHGGFHETLSYVGVAVGVLAGLACVRTWRKHTPWVLLLLGVFLYSLGQSFPLWRVLFELLPPLRLLRVPSRAWFIAALLFPYLAGWGLESLLAEPPRSARLRLALFALLAGGGVCSLAGAMLLAEALPLATWLGLLFLPATVLLLFARAWPRLAPSWLAAALCLVITLDGLWLGQSLLGARPRSAWLSAESAPPALQDFKGRLYSPTYSPEQQESAWWGLARYDGIDPFQLGAFVEQSPLVTGVPLLGYSTTVPASVVLDPAEADLLAVPMNLDLLGAWGVGRIVSRYPLPVAGLSLLAQEADYYIYANPAAWGAEVELVWETPNRVRQRVPSGAEIYTVANAVGWRSAEGRPVPPPAESVSLPAESGVFVYRPMGVILGGGMSLVSWAVLLVVALGLGVRCARLRQT